MSNGGGVFGALIFVVGILVAFAIMFGFFLIVPFFIFLAGIVVMLVSDRRGGGGGGAEKENGKADRQETVEVVETRTEIRESKS